MSEQNMHKDKCSSKTTAGGLWDSNEGFFFQEDDLWNDNGFIFFIFYLTQTLPRTEGMMSSNWNWDKKKKTHLK